MQAVQAGCRHVTVVHVYRSCRVGIPRGMEVLVIVLLVLAAVSFGAAAAGIAARVNLLALGLLFWVLAVLIPAVAALD